MKIKAWCPDCPTWPTLEYRMQTIYDAAKAYAEDMEWWDKDLGLHVVVQAEGSTPKRVLVKAWSLRATLLGEVE